MACKNCGGNKPLNRGRIVKPNSSITGEFNPHNITQRQAPRKMAERAENNRNLRRVPDRLKQSPSGVRMRKRVKRK